MQARLKIDSEPAVGNPPTAKGLHVGAVDRLVHIFNTRRSNKSSLAAVMVGYC